MGEGMGRNSLLSCSHMAKGVNERIWAIITIQQVGRNKIINCEIKKLLVLKTIHFFEIVALFLLQDDLFARLPNEFLQFVKQKCQQFYTITGMFHDSSQNTCQKSSFEGAHGGIFSCHKQHISIHMRSLTC